MNGLLLKVAITAMVGGVLFSTPAVAQARNTQLLPAPIPQDADPPPAPKPARIAIKQGPALEIARDDLAIIRWITNNPGGTDEHFGVVYYGTNPEDLSRMAKSHIRLNRNHPETIFRVRMDGLKPETTYYYKVTSIESNGKNDGVESSIHEFKTPRLGERVVNYPPQPTLSAPPQPALSAE